MVSVYQVYQSLKDLANKEQKGYITPKVFNSFAHIAQMNIFNELFSELVDAKKLSRQGFELGRDKSVRKQKLEDLSYFVKKSIASSQNNIFPKPIDMSRVISIKIRDVLQNVGVSENISVNSCEILYDPEKANHILGSNLSTPTRDFPVALVADEIEVFPASVNEIEIMYYRVPGSLDFNNNYSGSLLGNTSVAMNASMMPPFYAEVFTPVNPAVGGGTGGTGYDLGSGLPDYSSLRDFMLPDHLVPEIVMEMAKLLGVRLRDPNIQAFASREEAAE